MILITSDESWIPRDGSEASAEAAEDKRVLCRVLSADFYVRYFRPLLILCCTVAAS